MPGFFLDTNIFVYAHDMSDPAKTEIARQVIAKAHSTGDGVVSEQVIREFCNVTAKKFRVQMATNDIIETIGTELRPLLANGEPDELYEDALLLSDRFSISFYDAAIVRMAQHAKCDTLYSEDMQHGARFGELTIVNPFVTID